MACGNCKKVLDPSIPFAELDYTTTARTVGPHNIKEILIRIPNKPRGGWSVVLPLKGSPQKIQGNNAYEVASSAEKLFKLNGFYLDETVLWFNMNIQWLQRTMHKYHLVPLAQLLELATPITIENTDNHAMKKTSPETWTDCFWVFIRTYVDSDTYQWEKLLGFLNEYQRLLNPAENALLGDSGWYVRFTLALDKLKNNPAFSADKAKLWLDSLK